MPVPLVVVVWVGVVLGLDTGASLTQQRLLGLVTWVLLLGLLHREDRATRVQVGVVVAYASLVEYVFAGWLGVYVYRLENVPAFVPPGHGLVYLAALAIGRSAWAHRTPWLLPASLTACGAWAAWGLVLSERPDALGAFWFGCLLAFARWGKSPLLYAGAFLVVSYLELVGTSLGTWAWQTHDPTGLVTIGNPPSGIAGGYAWFDAAALALTPRLLRWWDARQTGTGAAARASTATASSTSTPPASWTAVSDSPSTAAATSTLTTGSNVDSTAVSAGPSRSSAAKNALTATTVPNSAIPSSASHAVPDDGSVARVPSAPTS